MLKKEIVEKGPQVKKEKALFRQDQEPCHTSMKIMVKLNDRRIQLLSHLLYSLHLFPSDYYLFATFRRML